MGVVGDDSRTSTVVTDTPFMGLVPDDTQSWVRQLRSSTFLLDTSQLTSIEYMLLYP